MSRYEKNSAAGWLFGALVGAGALYAGYYFLIKRPAMALVAKTGMNPSCTYLYSAQYPGGSADNEFTATSDQDALAVAKQQKSASGYTSMDVYRQCGNGAPVLLGTV